MPVLLISTSSRPNSSIVRRTTSARSSSRPVFAGTASTLASGTSARSCSAAASIWSGLRDEIVTAAPPRASSAAIACPMPRLAPVTSATLPWKSEVIARRL